MNEFLETIKEKLLEIDLYLRPQALIINPADEKIIREAIPDIEEKVLIRSAGMIPPGTAYLIPRTHLKYMSLEGTEDSEDEA